MSQSLQKSSNSWRGAIRSVVLFVLGGLSVKLVNFEIAKVQGVPVVQIDLGNPTHLQVLLGLSLCTVLYFAVSWIRSESKSREAAAKVTVLTGQVGAMLIQLEDVAERNKLQGQVTSLEEQLATVRRRAKQFFEFEGVYLPIPSLMAYVQPELCTAGIAAGSRVPEASQGWVEGGVL